MKFLSGVPEIKLYDINNGELVYCFKDIVSYSHDWENDTIYIDVAFVPNDNIKLDRFIIKLTFEQFADTEHPSLAPTQIEDYIEQYRVEYVGCWIPKAQNSEPIVFRHKFYVEWQER